MAESKEFKILNGQLSITALLKAYHSFEEIIDEPENPIVRDASIQRFEYCLELAWKTLKKVLKIKSGADIYYPNDVFREAAKGGLIQNTELWITFLEKRNLTSHTYNEATAVEVYEILPEFSIELKKLVDTLKNLK
ncbi:MAG: nucleotidyltransferase substrate binding protein [Deltaproteobacteria bacterium]|nr:nucleotidyltransferase substrate binding protein [Deltaproteobacteria bacterium]